MDLRKKLREAVENRDWGDIDIIFQNITHQMTFYSAAYVGLPYMVRLLEQVMEEGDVEHAHGISAPMYCRWKMTYKYPL